jgi:hypothetical protein
LKVAQWMEVTMIGMSCTNAKIVKRNIGLGTVHFNCTQRTWLADV